MATAVKVDVTASPAVRIVPPVGYLRPIAVHNNGAGTVYLGGSDVTAAAGFPLEAGGDFTATLAAEEALYAICGGSDTASLRVIGTAFV